VQQPYHALKGQPAAAVCGAPAATLALLWGCAQQQRLQQQQRGQVLLLTVLD
jgi:hypothetical protein